jgi:uncharacterized protein YlaN (UPF0358 family)
MQHSNTIDPGQPGKNGGKAGKPVDPLRAEMAARNAVQGQAMTVVDTDRVTSVAAITVPKVDLKEEILRTALGKLSDEAAMKVILTVIKPDEMGKLLMKLLEEGHLRELLKAMYDAKETPLKDALIATKIMPPPEDSLDNLLQNARMQHDGDGLVGKLGLDRLPNGVIGGVVQRLLEQCSSHQKLQLAHDLLKLS